MELIEVSAAQFLIRSSIPEDMVGDGQNLVSRRHDGLANAAARLAVEIGREITILFVTHCPGRLAKCSTQPAIALAGALTQLLSAALSISRTQAGPTGGVLRSGEDLHIRPQFRNQSPSRDHIHARNGAQPVDGRLIRLHRYSQALLQTEDFVLQELHLLQQSTKHPAMVLGNLSAQDQPELIPFAAQCSLSLI